MTTSPNSEILKLHNPSAAPSESSLKHNVTDRSGSVADRFPKWLKVAMVVVPLLAFIISAISLIVSIGSLLFSMGFTRLHEDHDVVARVLEVSAPTKGFSSIETNGELFVDVALINKGNQKEIIREAFLCYSDNKEFQTRGRAWERKNPGLNVQLEKGEKRVLHLLSPFSAINTGKRMWLGIAVRAIAPNADDIETVWPVCEISLAPDGNGSWVSYNKDQAPPIEIISNRRLPHQKLAPDGF